MTDPTARRETAALLLAALIASRPASGFAALAPKAVQAADALLAALEPAAPKIYETGFRVPPGYVAVPVWDRDAGLIPHAGRDALFIPLQAGEGDALLDSIRHARERHAAAPARP